MATATQPTFGYGDSMKPGGWPKEHPSLDSESSGMAISWFSNLELGLTLCRVCYGLLFHPVVMVCVALAFRFCPLQNFPTPSLISSSPRFFCLARRCSLRYPPRGPTNVNAGMVSSAESAVGLWQGAKGPQPASRQYVNTGIGSSVPPSQYGGGLPPPGHMSAPSYPQDYDFPVNDSPPGFFAPFGSVGKSTTEGSSSYGKRGPSCFSGLSFSRIHSMGRE